MPTLEELNTTVGTLAKTIQDFMAANKEKDKHEEENKKKLAQDFVDAAREKGEQEHRQKMEWETKQNAGLDLAGFNFTLDQFHQKNWKQIKEFHGDKIGDFAKQFQNFSDELYLYGILKGAMEKISMKSAILGSKLYDNFKKFLERNKALATTNAGAGLEWIPPNWSNEIIEQVRLARMVPNLIPLRTMYGPGSTLVIPTLPLDATGFKLAENTTDSPADIYKSQHSTGNITFTPVKLGVAVYASTEQLEDSIADTLAEVKRNLVQMFANTREDVMINGSTTWAHPDTDVSLAYDRRTAWMGFRHLCRDNAYWEDLSTFTAENIIKLPKNMGKYASQPNNFWLVPIDTSWDLIFLKDAANNPMFINNFNLGNRAPEVAGPIGFMFGRPVYVSEYCRTNLNATAFYDNITTTKHAMFQIFGDGFLQVMKRDVAIEAEKKIGSDTWLCVGTMRIVMAPKYPIASNRILSMGYNY